MSIVKPMETERGRIHSSPKKLHKVQRKLGRGLQSSQSQRPETYHLRSRDLDEACESKSKRKRFEGMQTLVPDQIKKSKTEQRIKAESVIPNFGYILSKAKRFFSKGTKLWIGKDNENTPVIVANVKETNDSAPATVEDIKLLQRQETEESEETKMCLKKEQEIKGITEEEMTKLHNIIVKHSPDLLKKHSNIQTITASRVKARGFNAGKGKIEPKVCIVIYVILKGIIPIDENSLPHKIDGYEVDVREGCFTRLTGDARNDPTYFKNLTVGCQITNRHKSGSLGGFIELPNKRVGCLTSFHLFGKHISKSFKRRPLKGDVFQPTFSPSTKFGEVIEGVYSPGNKEAIGVDAAVIEITQANREPTEASLLEGCKRFGFYDGRIITSFDEARRAAGNGVSLFKYGAVTGLTAGRLDNTGIFDGELHQQIEVAVASEYLDRGKRFAEQGDSGSLVFVQSDHGSDKNHIRALGLVTANMPNGKTSVTPIWAILESLALPKQLLAFEDQTYKKLRREIKTTNAKIDGLTKKIGKKIMNIINKKLGITPKNSPSTSRKQSQETKRMSFKK